MSAVARSVGQQVGVVRTIVDAERHLLDHRPAAMEAQAVGDLPDILDSGGIVADKTGRVATLRPVHRFRMPL